MRKWLSLSATSLLLMLGIGCLFASTLKARFLDPFKGGQEGSIEIPTEIDIGFIGVGPRDLSIPLRNLSSKPVQIERVATSCGCSSVSNPGSIPANGQSELRVKIKGNSLFAPRSTQIEIFLSSGEVYHSTIFFQSGSLPQLVPNVISIVDKKIEEGIRTELVIDAAQLGRGMCKIVPVSADCVVSCAIESKHGNTRFKSVGDNTFTLEEDGVHRIPLVLFLSGQKASNFLKLSVVSDQATVETTVHITIPSTAAITISPRKLSFVVNETLKAADDLAEFVVPPNLKRTLIIESNASGECKLLDKPAFLEHRIQKIDDKHWLVELQLISLSRSIVGTWDLSFSIGEKRATSSIEIIEHDANEP